MNGEGEAWRFLVGKFKDCWWTPKCGALLGTEHSSQPSCPQKAGRKKWGSVPKQQTQIWVVWGKSGISVWGWVEEQPCTSVERCTSCLSSSHPKGQAREVHLLQNCVIHSQFCQTVSFFSVVFVLFCWFLFVLFFYLGLLQHKWTESKNLISKGGNSIRCQQNKPGEKSAFRIKASGCGVTLKKKLRNGLAEGIWYWEADSKA